MKLLAGICAVLASMLCVHCYPDGPPNSACESMFPQGHNTTQLTSTTPFTITLSATTYCPGDIIKVTLNNNTATFTGLKAGSVSFYEGVFVQARLACTPSNTCNIKEGYGTWSAFDANFLKTMDCGAKKQNAICHGNKNKKYMLVASWTAPKDAKDPVEFMGTFVHETDEFFTGVKSSKITKKATCPASSAINTNPSLALLAFTALCLLIRA